MEPKQSLRRHQRKVRIAAVLLVATGCGGGQGTATPSGVHPRSELLLPGASAQLSVPFESAEVFGTRPVPAVLESDSPDRSLGVLTEPETDILGEIADGRVDRFGRVLVLDRLNPSIRVFDPISSRLTEVVGRGGIGPGEFQNPQALISLPSGRLLVLNALRRVSEFRVDSDSIAFRRSFQVNLEFLDGCSAEGKLVFHALNPAGRRALHVFDVDGDSLYSFGAVYETDNDILWSQLAVGKVACGPEGRVIYAPQNLPRVQAYSVGGELLWQVDMEGFKPVEFEVSADGGTRILPNTPVHMTTAVASDRATGSIAVSVAEVHRIPGQPGDLRRQHVVILDREGELLGIESWRTAARILWWDGDRLITARRHPFPQVGLHGSWPEKDGSG